MSNGYPVVRHHELGLFSWSTILRRRRRPLAAGPDQVLVYRIAGRQPQYLEGRPEDASARRVSAVTVVDVRRAVSIYAHCDVAAGELWWDFPVMAVFHCTVVSPATVVRIRRTDAIKDTDRYLEGILNAARSTAPAPLARDEHSLQRTFTEDLGRRLAGTPIPGVQVVLACLKVEPARYCPVEDDNDLGGDE